MRRILKLAEVRDRRRAAAVYFDLLERLRANPVARALRIVELHVEWEKRNKRGAL